MGEKYPIALYKNVEYSFYLEIIAEFISLGWIVSKSRESENWEITKLSYSRVFTF